MIVAITALIGAGKSTLVSTLAKRDNFIEFQEPVKENPFLNLYYEDPKRWAYAMQTYLLWERYKQAQEGYYKSLSGANIVLDSCIYSDRAFSLVQHWDKYFTEAEYDTYKNMYQLLADKTAYPDLIIWLDLKPEETIKRINSRGRECESGIPLDYLEKLYKAHQIILSELETKTKVIRVDARNSAEEVYKNVHDILQKHN